MRFVTVTLVPGVTNVPQICYDSAMFSYFWLQNRLVHIDIIIIIIIELK